MPPRAEPPLTDWPARPRDAARRALSMLGLNATETRVKVLADLYIAGRVFHPTSGASSETPEEAADGE